MKKIDFIKRPILEFILINLIPLLLIIINVIDLIDVWSGKFDYPFGSEFFSKYSIYTTQDIYVFYQVGSILLLLSLILLSLKRIGKGYLVLLAVNILWFFYPFIQ
jgi:hypothetical protein